MLNASSTISMQYMLSITFCRCLQSWHASYKIQAKTSESFREIFWIHARTGLQLLRGIQLWGVLGHMICGSLTQRNSHSTMNPITKTAQAISNKGVGQHRSNYNLQASLYRGFSFPSSLELPCVQMWQQKSIPFMPLNAFQPRHWSLIEFAQGHEWNICCISNIPI